MLLVSEMVVVDWIIVLPMYFCLSSEFFICWVFTILFKVGFSQGNEMRCVGIFVSISRGVRSVIGIDIFWRISHVICFSNLLNKN